MFKNIDFDELMEWASVPKYEHDTKHYSKIYYCKETNHNSVNANVSTGHEASVVEFAVTPCPRNGFVQRPIVNNHNNNQVLQISTCGSTIAVPAAFLFSSLLYWRVFLK
jgi:hypothetical protein